jgi:two-component system, cell cycle sensor histidine kinase and response regulator CckA
MILPTVTRRPARLIEQLTRPLPPLLAALFEDSGTGALVLDRDRRVVRTNRCLDAMLAPGATSLAAIVDSADASVEALFAAPDRQRVTAALVAALSGDPTPPLQARLDAANPVAAPVVALSVTPLQESDGQVSGLLLRLTDISAEKRLEAELAQLQRLQAVGQLAGGIAHDFNNLLMAIGAAAESVLERESSTPATVDDLRQIRQSIDRGAALVRQLLAFGRRQPLQPVVIPVNAAVRNTSDMLRRLLGERIRLQLVLEEPGRSVRADPTQLDRVLVNLAVNARDAMPAGGTLTLRTDHLTLYRPRQVGPETMPPGRYVAISVEDTGEGIAPDVLPKVFEPFFTTRRERGGSGLGLSTVHGIVRQSDGFITVDSTIGQGTSVTFWLPRYEEVEAISGISVADVLQANALQAVAVPAATSDAGDALPAQVATAERFLLLVEDEEPVRRLTERGLQRAGWQVSAAGSAEAALAGLPRPGDVAARPCALVSDIMLPGMDGTELVRAVRAVWPELPAVLISGYTDSALVGDLAAQGVSFLAKPFRLGELVACVERAIG